MAVCFRFWSPKLRIPYRFSRFHRRRIKNSGSALDRSSWWERFAVIVSAVAAAIALWQTFILKEQLSAADRNRATEAIFERTGSVCRYLSLFRAKYGLAGSIENNDLKIVLEVRQSGKFGLDPNSIKEFLEDFEVKADALMSARDSFDIWVGRRESVDNILYFVFSAVRGLNDAVADRKSLPARTAALAFNYCSELRYRMSNELIGTKWENDPVQFGYDDVDAFWLEGTCLPGDKLCKALPLDLP
jgi:hypothetical protein